MLILYNKLFYVVNTGKNAPEKVEKEGEWFMKSIRLLAILNECY